MTIDVRCRPPFKGFLQQFGNPEGTKAFTAKFKMTAPPSVMQVSEELMLREMDEAGIDYAIATGRNGHFRYSIHNDDIVELVDHYKGRFYGAMGVDCANVPDALKDIDKYVVNGKLIAISMEPGACPVPMYGNDRRLYPIYELCQAHSIPVIIMLGGRAGPTLSFSNPEIISMVANDFPKADFLVSHGGWPWVQPILGAAFWQENIWLCPDMYLMNNTGVADFVAAGNSWLQDRLLFGSAYPLMPIVESVNNFKALFDPAVLPKLLTQNAARLFNLPEKK